jgi:aspartate/methionine/tyrosine aminotransferase
MSERRDLLADGLAALGLAPLGCQGTYFLNVDVGGRDLAGLGVDLDEAAGPLDAAFCQWLVREVGVAAIPGSAFYDRDPLTSVVRFCFCKKVATLEAALDRLEHHFG